MNAFQNIEFVDRGRFATVLKAQTADTQQNVALKKLWVKSSLSSSSPSIASSPLLQKSYLAHCVEREIKILKLLSNHPRIIKMIDTFTEDEYVIIVLELMSIDLHHLLQKMSSRKQTLSNTQCKYIVKQLFAGLQVLHEHDVVHRDLKPANLLFDNSGDLKIADLGQARIIDCSERATSNQASNSPTYKMNSQRIFSPANKDKDFAEIIRGSQIGGCQQRYSDENSESYMQLTNEVGTRWYKSPELLYGTRKYGASIDIWSAGCIVVEILQCTPVFCGETDIDQLCRIFNILGTINIKHYPDATNLPDYNKIVFDDIQPKQLHELWSSMHTDVIHLIQCCLRFNPATRVTACDAMNHKWFLDHDTVETDSQSEETSNFKRIVQQAATEVCQAKHRKLDNFYHEPEVDFDNDDDDDDIISMSDLINECNLLDLE